MIEKGYGATVKGKLHKENKMPNQDYYLIDNHMEYTLVVVCDGLGSKKYSHHASKKLSKIIKKEVRERYKKHNLNPIEMVSSIQKTYLKKLWPYKLDNADTTCLFSLISNKNILLFQLGDGINAISINDKIILADEVEKDFTNETRAFGKSNRNDWKIKVINKEENSKYKLLLCTDGISEDLIEDNLSEFINNLNLHVDKKYKKNRCLFDLINNWPNKYSKDDKTIVVVK